MSSFHPDHSCYCIAFMPCESLCAVGDYICNSYITFWLCHILQWENSAFDGRNDAFDEGGFWWHVRVSPEEWLAWWNFSVYRILDHTRICATVEIISSLCYWGKRNVMLRCHSCYCSIHLMICPKHAGCIIFIYSSLTGSGLDEKEENFSDIHVSKSWLNQILVDVFDCWYCCWWRQQYLL